MRSDTRRLGAPAGVPRGLYGVADSSFGDVVAQARMLAEAGVGVVQLRCKGWSQEAIAEAAARCVGLGPLLVVNDAVGVARALGAWTHLGQGDGEGPVDIPFGRSCHELTEVDAIASLLHAGRGPVPAYIGFGPVFGTVTKDTGYTPRGVGLLAEVVRRSPVPVVAIGGITLEAAAAVRAAGAWGQAVIGGIWRSAEPRVQIDAFIRATR